MNEAKKLEVAKDSFAKATHYISQNEWARAFAHFLMFLELLPDERPNFEKVFEQIIHNLGVYLENDNRDEDLMNSYMKALRYFPRNLNILNNFGSHLLRLEHPVLALDVLEYLNHFYPNYLLAEKNIQTAKLNIIPRWHFRMLNDRKRNEAYCTAIRNAVTSRFNKVLDIGAGCGLLSYYASTCPSVQSITAIESSSTLANIAANALREKECVTVINKQSTELTSAEIGLSNLVVTEIFDTGLFGEHVLKTLIHAWEDLLEPVAKIIPHSADLFVTGISSEHILAKNKVFNKISHLNLENVCVRQFNSEPYEAEDLKQKSVKYITNTHLAVNINFSDYVQLKQIYSKNDAIPPFKLKCVNSGTIHAFAVWFNLHLDENVTITTNPLEDNLRCWEQAVIYLHHPVTLQENEEVLLQLSSVNDRLEIQILQPLSTCTNCFEISPEMITFLNDTHVVEAAKDLKLPDKFKKRPCQILDLNPVPLFALFQAKNGFLTANYQCKAGCDADMKFLDFLWRRNGFYPTPDTAITFKIFNSSEIYEKLSEKSFDIIFINPVSQNGTLCEKILNDFPILNKALRPGGIILPEQVFLEFELIDSKYLNFCHKVEENNLLGFKVAEDINKFSILEQWQIQPQYFPRKTLCNLTTETNILPSVMPPMLQNYNLEVPINGVANGVLYWFKMEFSQDISFNTYKSEHYNCACFIFKKPNLINSGDLVSITVRLEESLLKIDDEVVDET